jgi:hypothetical protein
MAIGLHSDHVVFNEQFYGGYLEGIADRLDVFNAGSFGCLSLNTRFIEGFNSEESYFKRTATKSSRRDLTSVAAYTAQALVQGQINDVKCFRKWNTDNTIGAFRTTGLSNEDIAFLAGKAAGDDIMEEWRLAAIASLVGAYQLASIDTAGTANDLVYDATDGTLASADLINGLKLFGDASSKVKAWLMHSTVFFNLLANQQASSTSDGVADMAIMAGTPATLGKPVIVVDDPSLIIANGVSSGVDSYYTFGLVPGAVKLVESEEQQVVMDIVTGLEQIVHRVQAEYAFNVGLRGISWTSATDNPTFAQLGTSSNWTKLYTSKKDLPGIAIKSRGAIA